MVIKRFVLVGALLTGLGTVAACGPVAAGPTTVPGSSVSTDGAAPSAVPAKDATTAAGGDGKAALQQCRAATGLSVALGTSDAGVTHRSVTLVFTNTGGAPCQLTGYPGVAALDAKGTQVAQAQRTLTGYLGGAKAVAPVTIARGRSASAVVEALAVAADGSACTGYAGLLVTAPDDTRSTRLNWHTDACATLQVHPVVAGGS